MIQLRHHTPRMWLPEMLGLLMPVVDIRRGSRHPLAWQGGDYLTELRATWRADRERFDLPPDTLVLGCPETLPTFAAVFRALGREVDDCVTTTSEQK